MDVSKQVLLVSCKIPIIPGGRVGGWPSGWVLEKLTIRPTQFNCYCLLKLSLAKVCVKCNFFCENLFRSKKKWRQKIWSKTIKANSVQLQLPPGTEFGK